MRYALIKAGKVVNIVEWDGESVYQPDGELVPLPPPAEDGSTVAMGWTYADGAFAALPEYPPA